MGSSFLPVSLAMAMRASPCPLLSQLALLVPIRFSGCVWGSGQLAGCSGGPTLCLASPLTCWPAGEGPVPKPYYVTEPWQRGQVCPGLGLGRRQGGCQSDGEAAAPQGSHCGPWPREDRVGPGSAPGVGYREAVSRGCGWAVCPATSASSLQPGCDL